MSDKKIFFDMFEKDGWDDVIERFKSLNMKISGFDACFEYENNFGRVNVEFHADDKALKIHILDKGDFGVDLLVKYKDNLKKLIKYLIKIKKTAKKENITEISTEIIKLCPETFLETEEGLKKLTIDK